MTAAASATGEQGAMAAGRYPWFCMWFDARTDAKLKTLEDDEHRVWHNLLCYASEQEERGVIADFDPFVLALEVARGDEELLTRTLRKLVRLKIVDDAGSGLAFINFDKRNDMQRRPSSQPGPSRDRKAKQREREREMLAEAAPQAPPDVVADVTSVTPPGADVTPSASVTSAEKTDVTQMSRDVTRCHDPQDSTGEKRTAQDKTRGGSATAPTDALPTIGREYSSRRERARAVALFEQAFWPDWPRKVSKHEAQVAFVKLNPTEDDVGRMRAAIAIQLVECDWPRENWRFCPHAATWLNQRRWEDEITPTAKESGDGGDESRTGGGARAGRGGEGRQRAAAYPRSAGRGGGHETYSDDKYWGRRPKVGDAQPGRRDRPGAP